MYICHEPISPIDPHVKNGWKGACVSAITKCLRHACQHNFTYYNGQLAETERIPGCGILSLPVLLDLQLLTATIEIIMSAMTQSPTTGATMTKARSGTL